MTEHRSGEASPEAPGDEGVASRTDAPPEAPGDEGVASRTGASTSAIPDGHVAPSDGQARGTALPAFSLRRPVTVVMLFLALTVLGFIAYRNIPLELVPSGFTPPFLYVQVPTLRSSPADIEERIAVPVEEMLSTVRGLKRIRTQIGPNSSGYLMELQDGTDMDSAYNQVRDRLERTLPDLGDDIGAYFIWKYNPSDDAVAWFGVTVDEGLDVPGQVMRRLIAPRLERIPGVSRVEVNGAPERSVTVELDDRLVSAAGTSTFELVNRLLRDNFALAGGTVSDSGRSLPLRVVARWHDLDEVRALPVGNGRTLGEVGKVYLSDRSERGVWRVNGRPGIFFAVYKDSVSNTVDVSRAVRRAVETDLRNDPQLEGFDYHFFFDQGDIIIGALDNLKESALWGGGLAVLILIGFLRQWGTTVLVTMAIPSSMLATIVFLHFTDRSLNVLSLTGLMLAVGMVVDNAIVVVESIQRHRQAGLDARRAALIGTGEVALAILVATLTTVVVFLPLILMSGNQTLSFYLSQIGLPVCIGLLASLVVSLVFMPLAGLFGTGTAPPPPARWMSWLEARYGGVLAWVLRRRADAALLALAVLASTALPAREVIQTDQSEGNINDFRIFLSMPDRFTWEDRRDALLRHEEAVLAHQDRLEIRDLMTRLGAGGGPTGGRAQLRAFLVDTDERELTREQVMEETMKVLPEIPGVRASLTWDRGAAGGNSQAITVRIVGPDTERLIELSREVVRRLRDVPGVRSVETDADEGGQPELRVLVDRDRSESMGLSAFLVGGTIDYALRGRRLAGMNLDGEELPVYAQGDLTQTDELAELQRMELPSVFPGVTLGHVAETTVAPAFKTIQRDNRRTVLTIQVFAETEDLRALGQQIDRALEGFRWPRGYSVEKGERFMQIDADNRERMFALTLAIVFVFLLMGVLFESFIIPFSILLSIPFAFTGVYWMLWATSTSFDMMAGVGLIILVGIVVNNAIVLVDRVVELRRRGSGRSDAIVQAGRERLQPILMTALTTIVGLIPMAIGTSSLVGIPYAPLGRAVIGGLTASTVLTLFVVPLFYTFLDDLSRLGGVLRARVSRQGPASDATGGAGTSSRLTVDSRAPGSQSTFTNASR